MVCHRNGDWARDLDFDMTTSPQPQQTTEIDREVQQLIVLTTNLTGARFRNGMDYSQCDSVKRDELARSITHRLRSRPDYTIPQIEQAVTTRLDLLARDHALELEYGDYLLIKRAMTDLFHELQSGKVE